MDSASPYDPAGEAAQILHALRHALADPLSAASLKLDLVERRVLAPAGADPEWVVERVRAAQTHVGEAIRLLGLLPRLAAIAGEQPADTSLSEVCLRAGVPLGVADAVVPRLTLRRTALADAIRGVASFVAGGATAAVPTGREVLENGRVTLRVAGPRVTADGLPGRLLDLPHGNPDAEALFVARAAAVADGGRFDLAEQDGHTVALFSWPLRPPGEAARRGIP